ncbi:MAG: lipopolysaccharide biosynthesis protein [Pedobacter sp.]|nr:MAG: lipopolysaccharide biosynthesis protein [Pedobacter sp.]
MQPENTFVDLREWFSYFTKKWKLLVVSAFLGLAVGLAYAFLKPAIYVADYSFALEDEKGGSGMGAYAAIAGQFGIDLGGGGGGAFAGDNLLELMKSRKMVEETLLSEVNVEGKTTTLAQLYIDFNKFNEDWATADRFPAATPRSKLNLQQDSLLRVFYKELMEKNLYVDKINKKLSIITVRVSTKNELFSKFFAEHLVKNVSDFYIATKTEKSAQNLAILQHQTDSVKSELNSAISGVATSTDFNPNANLARQILRVPAQRRQVDVQANTAILTELVKNLELSKITLRKETPLIQVIDTPTLPLEKARPHKGKSAIFSSLFCLFVCVVYLTLARLFDFGKRGYA